MRIRAIGKALLLAMAVSGIAALSVAQTAESPAFEVASIKQHLPSDRLPTARAIRGDRVIARNYTLRGLVRLAYSARKEPLLEQLLAGGPAWAATERFDIEAKASDGPPTMEQLHVMLQTLLADRFQLSFHRELREMAVYDLIVSKPEKLKLSEDQSPPVTPPPAPASFLWSYSFLRTRSRGASGMVVSAEGASLVGDAIPVSSIASLLQTVVDRPVTDKTGLTGLFDMQVLIMRREDIRALLRPAVTAAVELGVPPTASDPLVLNVVFESLQQEMGLRLQPSRGAVSVLVIDSVQRPTEN
jgi:uncharacterized protein (TIGR03435 family)